MDDRDAVVDPDRADGKIQAEADTDINIRPRGAEVIGIAIHDAGIRKDRTTNAANNREGELHRQVAKRVSADWVVIGIHWSDLAEVEAAHIVRATQIEAVKNWNAVTVFVFFIRPPSLGERELTLDEEDQIPRQREVFGCFERESVILHVTAQWSAAYEARKFDRLALASEEEAVTCIPYERSCDRALVVGVLGFLNDVVIDSSAVVVIHIVDAKAFNAILRAGRQGAPDLLPHLEGNADVFLRVGRGEEVGIAVEAFHSGGELVAHEPRFSERDDKVTTFETVLCADTETLTATGEVWPVGNVEVALLKFGKANQAVDGAEPGAEVEGSGALLLDNQVQILPAGNDRVGGLGIHP